MTIHYSLSFPLIHAKPVVLLVMHAKPVVLLVMIATHGFTKNVFGCLPQNSAGLDIARQHGPAHRAPNQTRPEFILLQTMIPVIPTQLVLWELQIYPHTHHY